MKVGDKVKVVKAFAGPGGTFANSTDACLVTVEITEKNLEYMDSALYAGFVEMYEIKPEEKVYLEDPGVLPDGDAPRKRGRKRDIQPEADPEA